MIAVLLIVLRDDRGLLLHRAVLRLAGRGVGDIRIGGLRVLAGHGGGRRRRALAGVGG